MPSKNMLPKGQRRRTVKHEYRATRGVEETAPPTIPVLEFDEVEEQSDAPALRTFTADPAAANLRLDLYLAHALPDISRARVQLLIEAGQVRVDGNPAKPKQKLHGGESIEIEGSPQPAPLHAIPEDIPLDILHEDKYLAVINKPAGMMVHAGAGTTDDARNRGTLVNALLFHFAKLSDVGGDLRPGIVHRLDKLTSGLILVAKDDSTHRKLGDMFSRRQVTKTYLALLHGHVKKTTPPSRFLSPATSSAAPA
jgi:23S rRNA pseudouridine1911/1915/1917 synthase